MARAADGPLQPHAPAVLPKSLYGNQLVAAATTMHYLHGIPLGKVCDQTGLGPGSVVEIFHRLARLVAGIPDRLVEEYRQAPVKYADETGWRTNGKNGYTWLFATPRLSLFLFRRTRPACPSKSSAKPRCQGAWWSIAMAATTGSPAPSSMAIAICCTRSKTSIRSSRMRPR